MTKGELRKLRKERREMGLSWNIELGEDGQKEIVRTRTPDEERRHYNRMERWARHMDEQE